LPERISKKSHDGIIYGLWPDADAADKIREIGVRYLGDNAESAYNLHLTIEYVGDLSQNVDNLDSLLTSLLSLATGWVTMYGCVPITGMINGYGKFSADDSGKIPIYLSVDSKGLSYLRYTICTILSGMAGIKSVSEHGFIPHITLGYIDEQDQMPDIEFDPFPVSFDSITLACGDTRISIPLVIDHDGANYPNMSTKSVWTGAYKNDLPDSSFLFIESGGKKDSEGKTTPRSKRHFPYKDASGKIDLPHLQNAIARIPQSNAPGLNKATLQKHAQSMLMSSKKGKESGLKVFKDSNGEYRWVLYSSNPYQDRDDEFVTQIAHEEDIKHLDIIGEYGPLRWWHDGKPFFEDPKDWTTVKAGPGLDLGTCDFAAMHGRIRIESGTFKSRKIAMAMLAHAHELEGSQGFAHPESEPDRGGGFLNIKTFERSLTPMGQASNLFTSFKVSSKEYKMDPKRREALKALGVDIEEVLEGAEKIQEKADKSAPYRMKNRRPAVAAVIDDDDDEDPRSLSDKLDLLTAQMQSLTTKMNEETPDIQEEKLEDLMVSELTVGEFQDVIKGVVSSKSLQPVGMALKAIMDELAEVKEILTSKSVQSVVDEVGRMKAKIERLSARTKGIGSKVRELEDTAPAYPRRGVRPSESSDTLFDDIDDADLTQKSTDSNPFAWVDEFISKT